jgi:AmmeMemoRadiSam system protein A
LVLTPDFDISANDRQALLHLARLSISKVLGVAAKQTAETNFPPSLCLVTGAFVTLHKNGRLRGCIGRMQTDAPLHQTIARMAVAAALEDHRFPPVWPEELEQLEVEISVLSPMQKSNIDQIIPGTHGVWLDYHGRSAVFLPQVAPEQGWDRDQLLNQLCLKAGLAAGTHKAADSILYRFTAIVFGENDAEDTQNRT